MNRTLRLILALAFALALVTAVFLITRLSATNAPAARFDGQRAWTDVKTQVELGPRTPGSEAHAGFILWLTSELNQAGWAVEIQQASVMGHEIQNIIARRGTASPPVLLAAHYDSRIYADQDPDPSKRSQPVPGANDGASGVAVLLELARTLPPTLTQDVWLVFFDAEDQGDFPGWDWILGSSALANTMNPLPKQLVLIDMIGDANLNIYKERTSSPALVEEIWKAAASAGYSGQFLDDYKYSMIDDHTPFLQKGVEAVDIIDFDYPYWHTTQDTPDKVSPQSLQAVGDTLRAWLEQRSR